MDQYNYFTIEDFVWDAFFRQWILFPTRETDRAWNKWVNENPEATAKIQQARAIVLSLRVTEPELTDLEIKNSVKETISKIGRPFTEGSTGRKYKKRPVYRDAWFQLAASAAFLLVVGWIIRASYIEKDLRPVQISSRVFDDESRSMIERFNASTQPMAVRLEDGSEITIASRGKIRYNAKSVALKREVYLEGEAFFDISKDPNRPFLVYSNGLVTKVLGTRFTIMAPKASDQVTVEVKTGRVSVFAESDPNASEKASNRELEGVVLNPNQKIIYARDEVRMMKTLVKKPEIVLPKAEMPTFRFKDSPASEAFHAIGRAYGIDLLFDEELLKECPLTAMLENKSFHEKLTVICKAVRASYEILDGQVIIHSKGCRN